MKGKPQKEFFGMKHGLTKKEFCLLLCSIPLALGADFSVSMSSRGWLRALSDMGSMHWFFHVCAWPLVLMVIWLVCGRPERLGNLLWLLVWLWFFCFLWIVRVFMSVAIF